MIEDKYASEEIEGIIIKLRILAEGHFDSGEQALANELLGTLRTLHARVAELEGVLKFYANADAYDLLVLEYPIHKDSGKIARQALEGKT